MVALFRVAVGCTLLASLATSAFAQAGPAVPVLPSSSVTMRMGPLSLAPSVLTSNGYDTNVTRVGNMDPISSYEFYTIPQLDALYQASTFSLTGTLAYEFVYTPGE